MSQEEISKLQDEEAELLKLLAEKRKQREELARLEAIRLREIEDAKPVVVTVKSLEGAMLVFVASKYRDDVIAAFKATPGRMYREDAYNNDKKNLIPIKEFSTLQSRLLELPNLEFVISAELESKIEYQLNAPKWLIEVDEDQGYVITPGPYVSDWVLRSPESGVQWKHAPGSTHSHAKFIVPFGHGWRLPDVFATPVPSTWEYQYNEYNHYIGKKEIKHPPIPMEGVVYTQEASERIQKQISTRGDLDILAKKKVSDLPIQQMLEDTGAWKFDHGKIDHAGRYFGQLMPFQTVSAEFGLKVHELGEKGFILADDMGVGKTLQSIVLALLMGAKRVIVVCPATIIPNWRKEILLRTGITPTILKGGDPTKWAFDLLMKPRRFTIISQDTLGKKVEKDVVKGEGLEATWTEHVIEWPVVDFLKETVSWDLVITDEAHNLKNEGSNRSKAARLFAASPNIKFRLPMSGSPVQNRPKEFWPILNIVAPAEFGSQEKFEDRYQDGNVGVKNSAELHELIKPYFLRRRKKDIFADLPAKNRIVDYIELGPVDKKRYDSVIAGLYEEMKEYDPMGVGGDIKMINFHLAKLVKLKKICSRAKAERTAELAIEAYETADENNGPRKVIIFTQFHGTAIKIAQLLGNEAICTVYKKVKKTDKGGYKVRFAQATVEERFELVERFQTDPNVHFFVATTKAMGESFTMTQAGTVIFNDLMWNPKTHEQAEDRAYARMNDMHGINAYYALAENTMEVDNWQLLSMKTDMIEETVEGVELSRGEVNIIRELLKRIRQQMWIKESGVKE